MPAPSFELLFLTLYYFSLEQQKQKRIIEETPTENI